MAIASSTGRDLWASQLAVVLAGYKNAAHDRLLLLLLHLVDLGVHEPHVARTQSALLLDDGRPRLDAFARFAETTAPEYFVRLWAVLVDYTAALKDDGHCLLDDSTVSFKTF